MTTMTQIFGLEAVVPKLRDRDREFASSLVEQFKRRGDLSVKQWPWVATLLDRAVNGYPAQETEQVGSFAGVVALLQKAREHLKYPKIRLEDGEGNRVVVSLAGPRSKHPGTVNVTDGGPYGSNTWWGRVDAEGTLAKGRACTASIEDILRRLSEAPARTAAAHGKLTGRCCFCNKHLEDERSTGVGYGPVCAKHYGMPW